jgi:hypothetical protein
MNKLLTAVIVFVLVCAVIGMWRDFIALVIVCFALFGVETAINNHRK